MSALGALFQPGGHRYRTLPEVIELLPKGLQHRATVAYRTAMKLLAMGELDERATDRRMAELSGWSPSLIQAGLHALDVVLGKILADQGQPPVIERTRAHGRRTIIPGPLAGRGDKPAPPAPPQSFENKTTDGQGGKSSSSSTETGERPPDLTPALLDAVGLLPDISAETLTGWVILARGTELAELAAAWLRAWLGHPRPENRPRTAYWAEKAILEWRRKLDAGTITLADIAAQVEAKARKWAPRPAPATRPTTTETTAPKPLTPDELADLLARCEEPAPTVRNFGRAQLRLAIAAGEVPAELVPTIPAHLLEPHPRE